ncbi:hypothetical protein AL755_14235 [Arthrobacter sp. ERGS1:01]|uniref:hypothetical protein n=1 Tax=Arthrobacter sp. ERGS1:01 TaxID=1704044 RepID=UPI0006B4A32E|nr:hypothetical protein [Arthrobacter sp. ERGS1:01]ALE06352.1 hypothetical protein AL755_14235 [Arthrobacter sp. ERGS1:01]
MITFDHVAKGMLVVDSDGHEIGKVSHVEPANEKIADFELAASASTQDPINLMLTAIFGVTPRVPKEMSARLFRSGFVKISGHGLWSGSRFASLDTVDHVDDRHIYLSRTAHQLDAL